MKKIEAYIQPFMLRKVEEALKAIHIHGMTVVDARGFGKEKDEQYPHRGVDYAVEFVRKTKIEIVCADDECPMIVAAIQRAAHTGRKGDGKIFVSEILGATSIRTGESGERAI